MTFLQALKLCLMAPLSGFENSYGAYFWRQFYASFWGLFKALMWAVLGLAVVAALPLSVPFVWAYERRRRARWAERDRRMDDDI